MKEELWRRPPVRNRTRGWFGVPTGLLRRMFEENYVFAKTHSDAYCGIGDSCIGDELRTMYIIEQILISRNEITEHEKDVMTDKINYLIRY